MRPPGGIAAPLLAIALVLPGCGGDGDDVSPAPGAAGAEQRVKEFLTAEFEGNSEEACGYIGEELQDQFEQTFGSCEQLIDTVAGVAEKREATFEDEPIEVSEIDELDLETQLDGDEKATVTGPRGKQSFQLEVIDGEWTITFISTD
jgi:hypothetical protein